MRGRFAAMVNITQTKCLAQRKTIAHHPPTDAQPVPEHLPPASSPPSLYTEHDVIWYGIFLWPVWVTVLAVSPPSFLCPPAYSLVGWGEKLKSPWLSVNTAQQQLKHQCVINIILILNPNHITVPATRKKINSIPAETRTPLWQGSGIPEGSSSQ